MYCAAAPYGCPTVIKIGGRHAGIASPNFGSALNSQEYSNVYSVETSGTKLSKKTTGAVILLTKIHTFSSSQHVHLQTRTKKQATQWVQG